MCLDEQILNTYIDGELAQPWKTQVEEHLRHCNVCKVRLKNIEHLKNIVKGAEISEDEIKVRQDRVLSIIEKKHIHAEKKLLPFHRKITIKVSQLVGAAAAFTFLFIGSWTMVSSNGKGNISLPNTVPSVVDISNITPARSIQQEVPKTLENYSLEEILQYLDAKGYNVDISVKGIQPIEEITEAVEENFPEVL